MTIIDKRNQFKAITNENDNAIIDAYLSLARDKILRRLYPFDPNQSSVPEQYGMTEVELATRLYFRRGTEGETHNSDNGVTRTYDSVDDADILARIVPFAKVV